MLKLRLVFILCAISGLGIAAQASARNNTLVLEEIIVTAQKRTESQADTPLTVNVMTGEQIDRAGVLTFQDLSTLSSGLSISGTDFNTNIAVRGLGTDLNASVSPRVAVYLDGAYIELSRAIFGAIYDMQQVELLRGPQGTLYGKASPAGTITLQTQNPSTSEFEGYARQTLTDRRGSNTQLGISIPVIRDTLGLRLSGLYDTNQHSGADNITLNSEQENETRSYRAVLYWQPTPSFDLRLAYQDIRDDFDVDPVIGGNGIDFDDRIALADFASSFDASTDYTTLEINYTFANDWHLTFIASEQNTITPRYFDQDASATQGREQFVSSPSHANIYELRLASQGNEQWDWILGAFYNEGSGTTRVNATTYLFSPRAGDIPLRSDTEAPADISASASALFMHSTIHTSQSASLTVGLRYNETERKSRQPFVSDIYGLIDGEWQYFASNESEGILPEAQDLSDDALTGTLKYQYRFSDALMAYGAYDHGWREGSANIAGEPQPPVFGAFDDESSDSLELGFKWSLWQGRGMWNIAVYYQVYTDFQYQTVGIDFRSPTGEIGKADPIVNVDEVETYGIDTDFSMLVTSSWSVRAALSYNHAELSSAEGTPCNSSQPLAKHTWAFNTCDLTGDRAGNQPELSGNVSTEYWGAIDSVSSEWYARALLNVEGKYYSPAFRSDLDDYAMLDLSLGLRSAAGSWDLNVWVKNITDATAELKNEALPQIPDYDSARMVDSGLRYVRRQLQPRLFGLTLNYNF